jgi:superfamily II DNA or RNA helicase
MSIELRAYQGESIHLLREGFRAGFQRQVLCLPTGAGKTVVFSEMVRAAAEKGTTTLILTDRTELFKQTISALGRAGVAVEEIRPGKNNIYLQAQIYLGMVETLKRRKHLEINPQLIILDEAHKANFTAIISQFPDARVIGATATPEGKHFFQLYQNIVQNIDIPELIELGFLSPCKAYQMQDDLSDLQVKAGEYTDHSLMAHFDKPKLYSGVIEQWQKLAPDTKTICFNVNIEHTIKMNKAFLEAGISSAYITSNTPKDERNQILAGFKSGSFLVLNNCGILTTGYDEPSIKTVIMNRATKSLPLFLQCAGRGSRIYPDKPHFTLLDFGMNHDRHGLWSEAREWKLKKPKEKSQGVVAVKTCPNEDCGCLLAVSAKVCKYCGYEYPVKESVLAEGIMVEVTPRAPSHLVGKKIDELNIAELLELEASKKYKSSFIWRVIRSMGRDSVIEYAKLKSYKQGWLKRQLEELENSEFTNYVIR